MSAADLSRGAAGHVERRSARYHSRKGGRPDRPWRVIGAALAAVVVVAAVSVLNSPLVPAPGRPAASSAPAVAATVPRSAPDATSVPESGLLVVMQGDRPVLAALFHAGPQNSVVLGIPGVTLLTSEAGFDRLADVVVRAGAGALAAPVAHAFGVGRGPVAVAWWTDLRAALAGVGGQLPEELDLRGVEAGVIAAALASACRDEDSRVPADAWWLTAPLEGEADALRSLLDAGAVGGRVWAGRALAGRAVEYANGGVYLEPDLEAAREMLAGGGAAPGAATGG